MDVLFVRFSITGGCTSTLSVMHIDVLDVSSTDLLGHLPPALSFLSSCNAGAIVHCLHGQSRSVAGTGSSSSPHSCSGPCLTRW